jgi:alkylation response protein AidB-like acyl-CoA dehydrogenase
MLAGRGEGFKIAMNALNVGRIKLAAACLDAQRRVTSNAINYANERIQFNTPISFWSYSLQISRNGNFCLCW